MPSRPEAHADARPQPRFVAAAIALAVAVVSAGVVLGHRPEAVQVARLVAAAVVPAAAVGR